MSERKENVRAGRVMNMPNTETMPKTYNFRVKEIDCASCAEGACDRFRSVTGISNVNYNIMDSVLYITPDDAAVTEQQILDGLNNSGFKLIDSKKNSKNEPGSGNHTKSFIDNITGNPQLLTTVLSGLFLAAAYAFGFILEGGRLQYMQYILYGISIISGVSLLVPKAIQSIRRVDLNMNVLMVIAVSGAVAIGEWQEAAMVVFLFAVSQFLEEFSMDKARRSVEKLMGMTPAVALVKRDGAEQEIRVEDVEVGEVFVIKPGDSIPLDGEIVSGNTEIDQSAITGEPVPAQKKLGDTVFAGTINGYGSVEVKVTRPAGETTLAKIRKLVSEAQGNKAPAEKFIDRFARYYTPAVIAVSAAVVAVPTLVFGLSFQEWLYRGLVILIIACPCALVISTPVAIVAALSSAARNGVLVKGGKYLEAIAGIKAIAFDKTGTLTYGRPRVTEIIPARGKTEEDVMRTAAAINCMSEHHIGKAIIEKTAEMGIRFHKAEGFQAMAGKGAGGIVEGTQCYIGNHKLAEDRGYCTGPMCETINRLEQQGKTVVVVGSESDPAGCIVVEDEVRENAAEVLKELRAVGVGETVMLTGDNPWTGQRIGECLGIKNVKAGLLPHEKLDAVKELLAEKGSIAMVGDGVNDAPALAVSTVGIAMGGSGTDVTLETADIALMSDDLSKLPFLIKLGRSTLALIRQNVIFALGLKLAFLVAAASGVATLWMAVFADTGASLIVIFNSLRLMKSRREKGSHEMHSHS